jgi:nitrite reductase/ring-hydroxylating ferredoxin subunit
MAVTFLKRGFFQRLFGIPATQKPTDDAGWQFAGGVVTIDLNQVPELGKSGGAVRLEGRGLPERVLVVHGDDGVYRAFHNRCRHMGRRLDPVPGAGTVQCCSVSKATYDYEGAVVHGPAKGPVKWYPVSQEGETLRVTIA